MQSLPKDTLFEIMHHITDSELTKLCQVDKTFSQLCRDDNFWKQRGITKFGTEFTVLAAKSALPSYKEIYTLALDLSFLLTFLQRLGVNVSTIIDLYEAQSLELFNNRLTEIPKEIGRLSHLKNLTLSKNNLVSLPKEIGRLQNLQGLNVSNNLLTTLPKEIGRLQNLQILNLFNNELESIPKEIGQLQNLQQLTLSYNRLTSLPKEIGNLQKLTSLIISNNPLTGPLEELEEKLPNTDISY